MIIKNVGAAVYAYALSQPDIFSDMDVNGEEKRKERKVEQADTSEDPRPSKKKRVLREDGSESLLDQDSERKIKKQKKEKIKQAELPRRLKTKKRKDKVGSFPDPEEDTSLNDQARKALTYAFAQHTDPSRWKFNKARQNWLVRNVWSDQAIPDVHLPLVLWYFANIKGGARENLAKICDAILDSSKVALAPTQSPEAPPKSAGIEDLKQSRAREIANILSARGDAEETP